VECFDVRWEKEQQSEKFARARNFMICAVLRTLIVRVTQSRMRCSMHHKTWKETWMFCFTLIWDNILSLTPLGNTIRQLFNLRLHVLPSRTLKNSTLYPYDALISFVWFAEQKAIISVYSVKRLVSRRVRKIAKGTISFALSGRLSAWNNSAATGRIFIKFDIWGFFYNLSRKFKFH
jgi:hypothetical protein